MADVMDFVNDRLSGMTLDEIGVRYGVSKQYVHEALVMLSSSKHYNNTKGVSRIVYPNLKKWFIENKTNPSRFSKEIGGSASSIMKNLEGTVSPSKKIIDKILERTGMTYEQAFAEEADNV